MTLIYIVCKIVFNLLFRCFTQKVGAFAQVFPIISMSIEHTTFEVELEKVLVCGNFLSEDTQIRKDWLKTVSKLLLLCISTYCIGAMVIIVGYISYPTGAEKCAAQ